MLAGLAPWSSGGDGKVAAELSFFIYGTHLVLSVILTVTYGVTSRTHRAKRKHETGTRSRRIPAPDTGINHLFRQEGHSTRHCKWQRAKSLDSFFHASGAPYYILTVSGAKPRGIKMAISEVNKTLAAALQSARALSHQTLVRPKEAAAMLGISRKHLYALADQPTFPKRIQVSDRVVAWRVADIKAWIDAKAQGGV